MVLDCLIMNWQRQPEASRSRVGIITAGKIGGAVIRNRARRLLRECFRLHQHGLNRKVDMVLVARPSIVGKRFSDVEQDFLTALRRAKLLTPASEITP